MSRRLIDLSVEIDEVPAERVPVAIQRFDHRDGARQMSEIFGLPESSLPDGLGWAGEVTTLGTHAGTHMDAPWHYGPVSAGRRAAYISEIPLEWCYGPGVVLDFRRLEDGSEITAGDLERALAAIGHRLIPGEIVLLHTGAAAHWGAADYPERGSGLGRLGILWLLERGIRIVGTDAWSLDRPFAAMYRDWLKEGNASGVWAAHFVGRELPYCQLEKLANLDLLPADGFYVACFPIKLARASASWARVVALLETSSPAPKGGNGKGAL
jgi:kynurenine formamidase